METMEKRRRKFRIKSIFKYIGFSLASLVTLIVVAFCVLLYGPFHQLRDLYVITMLETSAAKFMATWFLSDETIAEILENNRLEVVDEPSDPSLVSVAVAKTTTAGSQSEPPETTPFSDTDVSAATGGPDETTAPVTSSEPPRTTTVTTIDPLHTDAPAPDELYADHPDAMPETDGLDGLQLVKVSGNTFTGYMLVISDPSRVSLCVSYSILVNYTGGWNNTYGEQLRSMAKRNGAVAAINGGAFYDPDGKGNGGRPDGALCVEGKLIYWGPEIESAEECEAERERIRMAIENGELAADSPEAQPPVRRDWQGDKVNIIGINNDNILILGRFTKAEFLEQGFRDAVSFDNPNPPFLVVNGKASTVVGTGGSGIQPRTCIGQRADGAFLFLVIDGRGAGGSLGATQKEAMNLMIEFGAVNAANLDGGSSSEMIIDGETVSNPCSFYGPRYMPDGFMVR